jgi:hypothetical protein
MASTYDITTALRRAHELGSEAGEAAGSWIIDGNTSRETARRILQGIEDGDPEIMDMQPAPLSGEWADSPTPDDILEEITGVGSAQVDAFHREDLLNAFEEAYSEGFWDVVTRDAQSASGLSIPPSDAPTHEEIPDERHAMAYLMQDGNLAVPCGRYGSDTEDCARVAIVVARILQDATGEPTTYRSLDHVMGLVVNSSDEIASLILEHGPSIGIDPSDYLEEDDEQ